MDLPKNASTDSILPVESETKKLPLNKVVVIVSIVSSLFLIIAIIWGISVFSKVQTLDEQVEELEKNVGSVEGVNDEEEANSDQPLNPENSDIKSVSDSELPYEKIDTLPESDGFAIAVDSFDVPSDWVRFSDRDPDFGFKTTIYLPPEDYEFRFAGNQWILGYTGEPKEYWDYRASFSNDARNKRLPINNKYDGSPVEEWYLKFMNYQHEWQEFDNPPSYEYVSSEKVQIGNKTYWDVVIIDNNSDKPKPLKAVLYVENGRLHMFTDYNYDGVGDSSMIEPILGTVLNSLISE